MCLNNKPLISIITVVYNGEKYLQQTINSVLNQTYENIEYIIIDGGSTDGTLDIIKEFEENISFWISEPDEGLYDAMNKGIKIAKGDLIGMINSDDWYELDTVEIMVNAYLENPSKSIFHADRYDVDMNEDRKVRKFHPSVLKFKYYGMVFHHPSMFITKEEYQIHKYNIKLKALSDYQFVLEAYLRDNTIFHYIENPVVNYRLNGVSTKLSNIDRIKEGYISQRSAGLTIIESLFSQCFRLFVFVFYQTKNNE